MLYLHSILHIFFSNLVSNKKIFNKLFNIKVIFIIKKFKGIKTLMNSKYEIINNNKNHIYCCGCPPKSDDAEIPEVHIFAVQVESWWSEHCSGYRWHLQQSNSHVRSCKQTEIHQHYHWAAASVASTVYSKHQRSLKNTLHSRLDFDH